jgi:transcriptional regulator with XRE-family HTH domain
MGRATRPRPERLAEKLKAIRLFLGLSQTQMVKRLNYKGRLQASEISEFERDIKPPPIQLVLCYARTARVSMECLVDDEMDLPRKFTSSKK